MSDGTLGATTLHLTAWPQGGARQTVSGTDQADHTRCFAQVSSEGELDMCVCVRVCEVR